MAENYVSKPRGEVDEEVKRWYDDLDRGLRLRREHEKRWEQNEKFEDMRHWEGEFGKGDEVSVNKVGSFIRTYRAQISFNDPRAKLTPRTSDGYEPIPVPVVGPGGQTTIDPQTGRTAVRMVNRVKVREALLNDILAAPMAGTQAVNSRLVRAGCLGWGCLKSGYAPTFETEPEKDGDQELEVGEDGSIKFDDYVKNPITGALEEDEQGRLIRRDHVPIYEDFFITWVPYRNMIIDPDGGNDWSDHRWVAEEVIRTLDEVKEDPLYENTDDLKCTGYRHENKDGELEWRVRGTDWADEDEMPGEGTVKLVRLFEIYDLVNERLLVMADGHGKFLRDVPTPPGIPGHPYSDFRPNEVLGRFYQRPIVTDLCPINQQYNMGRQAEMRAMRRSTRKNLVKKGALDATQLSLFTNDEDMQTVEVDLRGHANFTDVIWPYVPPPVNDALYRNTEMTARDFDEVAGISEAGRGRASGGTATETNVMEQYSGSRIDFERKVLGECWRRAIKKLNDSLDYNMTMERAVMMEGSDGMAFVGLVDRDLIAGDFEVEIDVEDMAPANSAVQGAQMVQLMQVAGQSPWLFADEVLAAEMVSSFGIKNLRFAQKLAEMAKAQMQIMAADAVQGPSVGGAPGPSPEAPPPASEADAISQVAAGGQAASMQGAT